MAEIVEEGYQSRLYQRRWLTSMVLDGGDGVVHRSNLPILGVFLDARSMVADVATLYREALERNPDWGEQSRFGLRPVAVDESGNPQRTWNIGPEGLMAWDTPVVSDEGAVSGRWRYMTEQEIADSNLLHGFHELVEIPHQQFLARDEGYNDHLVGTVDKLRMVNDPHYAKGVEQAAPEVIASGRRVVAPIGKVVKELVSA